MENIWQDRLRVFIDSNIENSLSSLTVVDQKDTDRIRGLLQIMTEIRSANDTEPLLKYNDKFVTPREHLVNLLDQLKGDIYPILQKQNAPFTALRNIMCFAEYIALLKFGTLGQKSEQGNLPRLFGHFSYGRFEKNYREYSPYLIQLYRHDLIHLTSPRQKIIYTTINNITGLSITGFYIDSTCPNNDYDELCSLMRNESNRSGLKHLRLRATEIVIHVQSLYFDLVLFIKDYISELAHNADMNEKFAQIHIKTTIRSALKVYDNPPINQDDNKHIRF